MLHEWHFIFKTFVLSESCDDGILNQDEEKMDCGGSCPACPGSLIKLKLSKCIFFATWNTLSSNIDS